MNTLRSALARGLAALSLAAVLLAPPAAAAVHEDDWLKVETPDKVSPGSGFQVKVTLKRDLGPEDNVTVAMHRMKPDGNWRDTGEWRPPQSMKKGETKVYSFTAAWADDVGHFSPLVFTAPKGDWNKATHKLFCGKIEWAMNPEQAAAKKKQQEEAEARKRPPAGITYKKSWLQPRGCFKPGTDEPLKELREGDSFELVADYYLDPSEYWNDKCHVVAFPCGPWIDNPDGVYEKGAHHVGYEGLGWSFKAVTPGKGTVRFKQTLKKAYRYNSLFYHVRFRGGDDKDFPWTKTCGAPAIARHLDGLDLVAPVPGGLFVQGREKPVLDLLAAPGSKQGAEVSIRLFALDSDGKLDEVGVAKAGRTYALLDIAENGWYHIRLLDGLEGYISSKLVQGQPEIATASRVIIRKSGNANVRQEADAASARVGVARAGRSYPLLSTADNGWYRILLYGGIVGYVSPKVVSRVSEPGENPDATPAPAAKAEEAETGNTVTIRRQGNVNVRQEPKFDSEKVGTAIAGRRYPLLDTAENGWYRIRLGNGVEGYISNKLAK